MVGHSLGAHVAGTTGATIKKLTNEQVARVTGLDPAYPLFAKATPDSGKIAPADAKLVDVIHTACGRLGLQESVGHVDFYANGGRVPQPGCGLDLSASCSHERVCFLYAESVGKPNSFPGHLCTANVTDVAEQECTGPIGHMGEHVTFSEKGKYYVRTEGEPPYNPAHQSSGGSRTTTTERAKRL